MKITRANAGLLAYQHKTCHNHAVRVHWRDAERGVCLADAVQIDQEQDVTFV